MADPEYYLTCTPLPGSSTSLRAPQEAVEAGVMAISATHLQGDLR